MAPSSTEMDVDVPDSTPLETPDRQDDSDIGGSQDDSRGAKRIRAPAMTKLIKWNDIPNWYSRKDCPLLELPSEILDRIFSLETGLGVSGGVGALADTQVRDYVALAGVSRTFRHLFDDAVFKVG